MKLRSIVRATRPPLLALMIASWTTGCGLLGDAGGGDLCSAGRPQYFDDATIAGMSRAEKEKIAVDNKTWEERCLPTIFGG